MKTRLAALLILGLTVATIVAGARLAEDYANQRVVPKIDWAYIPTVVPDSAPFAAWLRVDAPPPPPGNEPESLLGQLRICGRSGECVLGSRQGIVSAPGIGLVTASRDLERGDYDVSLLLVRPNRFGIARTVATYTQTVTYGDGALGE